MSVDRVPRFYFSGGERVRFRLSSELSEKSFRAKQSERGVTNSHEFIELKHVSAWTKTWHNSVVIMLANYHYYCSHRIPFCICELLLL